VSYLIRRYRGEMAHELSVNYRRTPKNAGPGKVFSDLGFQVEGETEGVTRLLFPRTTESPDDGLVAIEDMANPVTLNK